MPKRISLQEYMNRLRRAYPEGNLEPLNYTTISNPVDIRCNDCGKVHHYTKARFAITSLTCCFNSNEKKIKRVLEWLDSSEDFEFIKRLDSTHILVRHLPCGNIFKKNISQFFSCPEACLFCKPQGMNGRSTLEEAQEILDARFFGELELLQYNGRHEKCLYRCTKCGQIFKQKFDCLLGSSGCPKCDRKVSLGERMMKKILEQDNIIFRQQVRVKELGLQRFDFGIYLNKDDIEPYYFIEVQGQQHFRPVEPWGGEEALLKTHELDEKKRQYCKSRHIPLFEIIYDNQKLINLDILPFDTTTISAQESRG